MESFWREQQFEMDEDMPFLESSITVPTSIVDISSDEENDAPMLAAGPSIWQSNMEEWVMQRSNGNLPTAPILVPECSIDQYMELEDGLLPLEYVAFGETMPSPISSARDHLPTHNVNPPPVRATRLQDRTVSIR